MATSPQKYNWHKERIVNLQKSVCAVAFAGAACLASLPALADSGVYIGGGVGQSNIEDKAGNSGGVAFDESDAAWRGFVGYNLDLIPLVKFALELGYRDLGKPDATVAGIPVTYEVNGIDFSVLAGVGLGPVDLFGRVGGMQYDLEKNIGGLRTDFDGTAPVYGVGVWFTIAGIGLRAEYDVIDIDELDYADVLSISAFYKF